MSGARFSIGVLDSLREIYAVVNVNTGTIVAKRTGRDAAARLARYLNECPGLDVDSGIHKEFKNLEPYTCAKCGAIGRTEATPPSFNIDYTTQATSKVRCVKCNATWELVFMVMEVRR